MSYPLFWVAHFLLGGIIIEMRKTKSNQRAKEVEKIIRLAWDSLQSHLPYTRLKSSEGVRFHKLCIRQYAEIIQSASKLY